MCLAGCYGLCEAEEAAAAAARRRRVAAAFWWLTRAAERRPGPQGKNRSKPAFRWADHVHQLTEDEFKARYRLGSSSFYNLLYRLEPHLRPAHAQRAANANAGQPVEPATKLAVAARGQ